MERNHMPSSPGQHTRAVLTTAALLLLLIRVPAHASHGSRHPAQIDGEAFVELADPDGELVEISLSGKLLKLLTTRAVKRHDADIAAILADLVLVHAVIADVDGDGRDAARRQIERTAKQLDRSRWERFVRVRDDGEDLAAYVHFDKAEEVDGIVVMGFVEADQLVFVNLAGRVDMERIAMLGDRLGVPGLDDLPSRREIDERRDSRSAPRRKSSDPA